MNIRAACSVVLAALLSGLVTAQEPPKKDPPAPTSWPKLSSSDAKRAKNKATLVGLSGDDEEVAKASAAEADLVAYGTGVAPVILRRLGDREVAELPESAAALGRILDAVCTPEYAGLIAERTTDRSVEVRRWSVGWIGRHTLPDQEKALRRALGDDDAAVSFRAALGLLGLGNGDVLDKVLADCMEDWRSKAALVDSIAAPGRSNELAQALVDRIANAPVNERVTGLRLARSLCPKDYAAVLGTFLDDDAATVKKEAINALRVVVDGDEPLENLSVFQAIDAAKKWKERLR